MHCTSLLCVPPPHEALQGPQISEATHLAPTQGSVAQVRNPEGWAPAVVDEIQLLSAAMVPLTVSMQRILRVCCPPPHRAEQADQGGSVQANTGHGCVLQLAVVSGQVGVAVAGPHPQRLRS
jgi:hypothetical protein